jgi:site-specific DNA-adenine methylase
MRQGMFDFDSDARADEQETRESGLRGEATERASPVLSVASGIRSKINRIRPPVKAHGGKYYLGRQIVPILLSAPGRPTEYLEPCAFGASVFLAMPRFEREILGDINPGVVELWRTLAHERLSALFAERLSDVPYNEQTFEEAAKRDTAATSVDAAIRFVIRSRFSRGGLGKSFAWSDRKRGGRPGDENAWNTFREKSLPQIIERARGVEVVQDDCWWTVWEAGIASAV